MHGYLYIQSSSLRHAYIHSVNKANNDTLHSCLNGIHRHCSASLLWIDINLPNFVKDINSRLLQQDIFNKGGDGNLFSAGMNQVLSNVGFSHHIGAKRLGSVNHGLKQRLQCSIKRRERDEDTDPEAPACETYKGGYIYDTEPLGGQGWQENPRVRLGFGAVPGWLVTAGRIIDLLGGNHFKSDTWQIRPRLLASEMW